MLGLIVLLKYRDSSKIWDFILFLIKSTQDNLKMHEINLSEFKINS